MATQKTKFSPKNRTIGFRVDDTTWNQLQAINPELTVHDLAREIILEFLNRPIDLQKSPPPAGNGLTFSQAKRLFLIEQVVTTLLKRVPGGANELEFILKNIELRETKNA